MQIIHKGRKGLITKANKRILGGLINWKGKTPIKVSSVTIVKVEDVLFFIRNGGENDYLLPMIFVPYSTYFDIYRSYMYKPIIKREGKVLHGEAFKEVLINILKETNPKTAAEMKFILGAHPDFSVEPSTKSNLILIGH